MITFFDSQGNSKVEKRENSNLKKKEKYKNHKNRPSLGLFLDFSTISILRHIEEFRFYNSVYFRHQTFYVPICQNNECFLKLENVKKGVETVRTHSIHLNLLHKRHLFAVGCFSVTSNFALNLKERLRCVLSTLCAFLLLSPIYAVFEPSTVHVYCHAMGQQLKVWSLLLEKKVSFQKWTNEEWLSWLEILIRN